MIIIGAKGFAKEVLEILHQKNETNSLCFYDDISNDLPETLFEKFPILRNEDEARKHFSTIDTRFVIGIGNPHLRKKMFEKFSSLGGTPTSIISKNTEIGSFDNNFEDGIIITSGSILTNSITIKKGSMINLACTIGHDSTIGEFVEICPNVSISGHCNIGNNVFIGTGSTILPNITIGENSVIAAGSVVTKNIPDNVMAAGIPAVVKKQL